MKIAILGNGGPLAQATGAVLQRHGHQLESDAGDCAIFFPGSPDQLRQAIARGGYRRLILRSYAYAYGSSTKNPGMMAEDRVSLLPEGAPERRWLELETIAAGHPNSAIVRLTNVL